jgi:hypothetical protein
VAKHEIRCTVPATEVVNTDLEVAIWSDKRLLGRLHISRGSLDWTPGKSPTRYSMGWERFAEVIAENGRREVT